MNKPIFTLIITAIVIGMPPVSNADWNGLEYVVESDILVYGGLRFFAQSRNAADLRTLRTLGQDTGESDVIYQSSGILSDIKASPGAQFIGVLEKSSEQNVGKEQSNYVSHRLDEHGNLTGVYHRYESILRILTLDGELVASIPDVHRYVWSPSGQRIAYITGNEYEGGFGFSTTGSWVYEVVSRQIEAIFAGGYEIQWTDWDGNVYIYDQFVEEYPDTRVFQFDMTSRQIVETAHQGIFFSPSGRRYYAQGYEGATLRIFDADTDEEISADLSIDVPGRILEINIANGWLDDDTIVVPNPYSDDQGDFLYGVGSRSLWQADGPIVPVRLPSGDALVLRGTSVVETPKRQIRLVR